MYNAVCINTEVSSVIARMDSRDLSVTLNEIKQSEEAKSNDALPKHSLY